MTVLFWSGFAVVMLFGFVVFYGAPYLPTTRRQVEAALDLLDLKPGQTMLELGSGDGRVMLAAARRGWHVIGVELNPLLVVFSKLMTLRYRRHVRVVWGSFWRVRLPQADGIFVFLLDKYMNKLDKKITQEFSNPVKLVSFAFRIPDRRHVRENGGVYLYKYPGKGR
jgi:SAM-dependent methyltransferase